MKNMYGHDVPEDTERAYSAVLEFVDEMKNESDRAVVLIAGAKLDDLLFESLKKKLIKVADKSDPLLSGPHPIGSFSARISLCYRLGMIEDDLCRSLNKLRELRNKFAHLYKSGTLDDSTYLDKVKSVVSDFIDNQYFQHLKAQFSECSEGRALFMAFATILVGRLETLLDVVKEIDVDSVSFTPPLYLGSNPEMR